MLDAHDHEDVHLSGPFPLEFSAGIPNPGRFPPAPDELVNLVAQYHRGLNRVAVKIHHGRKRYSQINSIIIGARHDELPAATVDQIVRAVLAIAQDHYETTDQAASYMAQLFVHLKPTGDPVRKACHFQLGSEYGGSQDPYTEYTQAPEHLDEVLLTHIRECHVKIMDQANVIAEIGKTAIQNAGQVFQYKQEALDAQAAAQSVILDARRDEARERASQAKWDRGFKMLEKAVNSGIAQALVSAGTGGAVSLPGGAAPAALAGAPGVPGAAPAQPETPMPAWASGGGPGKVPATVTTTTVASSSDDSFDDLELSLVDKGRRLYASVSADQWPELFEELTKAQVKHLRVLKAPESEAAMLDAVKKFRGSMKDGQLARLGAILNVQQLALIIELASAAEE
jgi:hypothetical protein